MPPKTYLNAKKQRESLCITGGGLTSLAEVIRQLRHVLFGGRRRKIYGHHVFYRRAAHALFYLKKVLPYTSSWKQQQAASGTLTLSQTTGSSSATDLEQGLEETLLQSKAMALLCAAAEAAAMEMAAQRIDTAAVSSAVVVLLAVAGKMLPSN